MRCKKDLSWIGQCKNEAEAGEHYCKQHLKGNGWESECCICGEQATTDCEHTMSLVCGAPLCSNPECRRKHGH